MEYRGIKYSIKKYKGTIQIKYDDEFEDISYIAELFHDYDWLDYFLDDIGDEERFEIIAKSDIDYMLDVIYPQVKVMYKRLKELRGD